MSSVTYLEAIIHLHPGAHVALVGGKDYNHIDWGTETPISKAELDAAVSYLIANPPPAPPVTCSPWQMRKALNQLELRDAVEAAVSASTDQTLRDGWEFATEFRSDDPFVIAMGATLGKTEAEVRAIIELGATL